MLQSLRNQTICYLKLHKLYHLQVHIVQVILVCIRYLIYDVNPGEGFNLRRDVYIRIANLVHFLNELEPWILVLPPWGNLYHWQSDVLQEKLPWSHFFDVNSLKRHVPVIEFEEFLQSKNQEYKK